MRYWNPRTLFLILAMPVLTAMFFYAGTFQGSSAGVFSDPNPTCPPAVCTGIGTDAISWGSGQPSTLGFRGRDFDVNLDETFVIGEMDYFNGTTTGGTAINSVDLCLNANITTPAPQTVTGCSKIEILNSPNTSDPFESADSVTMRRGGIDFFVFESDGASATVEAMLTLSPSGTQDEFELVILGFGEITDGNGFLGSSVYLPLIQSSR